MPEPPGIPLFSYGTLQRADIQMSCFGRLLEGTDEVLTGYILYMADLADPQAAGPDGHELYPMAEASGNDADTVEGRLFFITEPELAAADEYEGFDYRRIETQLKSGKSAWVYVKA